MFFTIGDAATSEGHFLETVNAAAVMQETPIFVWDDGYGISSEEIPDRQRVDFEALKGFQKDDSNGLMIYKVKAWDYAGPVNHSKKESSRLQGKHIPVITFMWKR
jgi:TPP-dependent pyruvate/acetoin dehydrogenase alpha subunit